MKSAMLLEYDDTAREQTASLLQSLGYVVACAATPQAALHASQSMLAPGASIVYLLDSNATGCGCADRASALLFKPVTLAALRRVLEFGVDGLGQQQLWVPLQRERRRMPQRRLRTR
jgi:hypothetical protein